MIFIFFFCERFEVLEESSLATRYVYVITCNILYVAVSTNTTTQSKMVHLTCSFVTRYFRSRASVKF